MRPPRRRVLASLALLAPARCRVLASLALGPALASRAGAAAAGAEGSSVRRGRALSFPRDHGAHLDTRTEWWYLTGWLGTPAAPRYGFQVTFFRSATGLAAGLRSRYAARQLLFAHAAVTDLREHRHVHDERIARWNEDAAAPAAHASSTDTGVAVGDWTLQRRGEPSRYRCRLALAGANFAIDLELTAAAPPLLQGDAGWSQKGPDAQHASHYVSEPQLDARGSLRSGEALAGRGWLDHEWSDALLPEGAVGWDWIGINLADGSAMTAFRLRRADGTALWAGGSLRTRAGATRAFTPDDVRFDPARTWRSPASGAAYPVQWQLRLAGVPYTVRALLDAQELDSRRSTGAIYWEGLAELLDAGGQRVGLGYLEMTGYAAPIRIG